MRPGKYTIRIEEGPPEPDRTSPWATALAGAALIMAAAAMIGILIDMLGA